MAASAVFLKQFEESTHQNGSQKGPEEQFFAIETCVTAQVLYPDDATGATIHDEVGPFVDEGDVVERRLREYGGERQNPDKDDAADRKGVLFYVEH